VRLKYNFSTPYLDQPQPYWPAACVITQQCSSTTYVSLCLHSRKDNIEEHFKNITIIFERCAQGFGGEA
jgi:hypothetical protein